MRAVPRLGELYPGICLTTEEKARKNLSQGSIRLIKLILLMDRGPSGEAASSSTNQSIPRNLSTQMFITSFTTARTTVHTRTPYLF